MELNENFRYETRLEKKNLFIVCLCFKDSDVNKENDVQTMKRKLEIIKLSEKDKQNW